MNEIDEIKTKLDIVDVISSYIKLEKAGINYKARCPFHNEKSPSFVVSPQKQIYHCFGCSAGGDMFEFIKEIEGVDFYDALKILADKAGVELKKENKNYIQEKTERQKLLEVLNQSAKFFEYYLENSEKGKEAKEYLIKRGFTDKLIKDWKIGYAPNSYTALSKFLEARGYNKKFIEGAGLAFLNPKGALTDRFRSRITFPFFSINSEVIGFTGRIFGVSDDKLAKYLNTPATRLYDKSKALFGIDKAKLEIKKQDKCVLVEGNVDCILSSGAGVENVVAVSGTALTELHLNILKRYTNNLVFAFDMDEAGNKATFRAIDLVRKIGFNVSVVSLDAGMDPADIILLKGIDEWKKAIEKAEPIMDFYFRIVFLGKDLTKIGDIKKISAELLPQIKKIDNHIERAYFIQKLSEMVGIKEADIRLELDKIKIDKGEAEKKKTVFKKDSQQEKIEKRIIKLYLLDDTIDVDLDLFSLKNKTILEKLKNKERLEDFIEDKSFLSELLLGGEYEVKILEENEVTIKQEVQNCILNLKNIIQDKKLQDFPMKLRREKDLEKEDKLVKEYHNLVKED